MPLYLEQINLFILNQIFTKLMDRTMTLKFAPPATVKITRVALSTALLFTYVPFALAQSTPTELADLALEDLLWVHRSDRTWLASIISKGKKKCNFTCQKGSR